MKLSESAVDAGRMTPQEFKSERDIVRLLSERETKLTGITGPGVDFIGGIGRRECEVRENETSKVYQRCSKCLASCCLSE